jgi:hypothetical protein
MKRLHLMACCLALLVAAVPGSAVAAVARGAAASVTASAGARQEAHAGLRWSHIGSVDPDHLAVATSMSCPGRSFCVASDFASVVVYNGRSWGAPRVVLPALNTSNPAITSAVSCASSKFCAVVGSNSGNTSYAATFDGRSWSKAEEISPLSAQMDGISCVSPDFCMAISFYGTAFSYDGHGWSGPVIVTPQVPDRVFLDSVSCASSTYCVAVTSDGSEYTYDSGAWGQPTTIDSASPDLTSVSCPAVRGCVAVTAGGQAIVEDAGGWQGPVQADAYPASVPGTYLASVSCAAPTTCLAVDSAGHSTSLRGGTWAAPLKFSAGRAVAVSCPPAGPCEEVDNTRNAVRTRKYAAGGWTRPVRVDHGTGDPDSVACAAAGYCAIADGFGNAVASKAGKWGRPRFLADDYNSVISCSRQRIFCLAGSSDGFAAYDGVTWKKTGGVPLAAGPDYVTGLSCVSKDFCAAVESRGIIAFYNGSGWAEAGNWPGETWEGISCATKAFCMAVDSEGNALTYSKRKWTASHIANAPWPPISVSCPAAGFCRAAYAQYVAEYSHATWGRPRQVLAQAPQARSSISCPDATFCALVADSTVGVLRNGNWNTRALHLDRPDTDLAAVSCATDRYCVILGSDGTLYIGT